MREKSEGMDGLLSSLVGKVDMDEAVKLLECGMIQRALDQNGGNQSAASRLLGIHRNTLMRKVVEYGIGEARPRTRRKPASREVAARRRKNRTA